MAFSEMAPYFRGRRMIGSRTRAPAIISTFILLQLFIHTTCTNALPTIPNTFPISGPPGPSLDNSSANSSSGVYSPPYLNANFTGCIEQIKQHSIPSFTPEFVDWWGNPVDTFNNPLTKGVSVKTCYAYCGSKSSPTQWTLFSGQFTAWLLPFIALTAQFPYQAGTTWDNFMSAFLFVGSPALGMYALLVTVFSSRALCRRCDAVADGVITVGVTGSRRAAFGTGRGKQIKGVMGMLKKVLCMAQQEPFGKLGFDGQDAMDILLTQGHTMSALQAGGGKGADRLETEEDIGESDKQLINLLKADKDWWEKVSSIAVKTKRGYTASFVHQLLWANVAFAFTVVDAFAPGKIGANVTAFGLAISLIWQWETPVVLGWVLAGVQTVDYAISDAIEDVYSIFPDTDIDASRRNTYRTLRPIPGTSNPINLPHPSTFFPDIDRTRPIAKTAGDKAHPGPIFNYARVHTWAQRSEYILYQYKLILDPSLPPIEVHMSGKGKSLWKARASWHIWFASILALLVQWSTAGASFFLNFLTPTTGLGCRSGGIMIYAITATVVWGFLVGSAYLGEFLEERLRVQAQAQAQAHTTDSPDMCTAETFSPTNHHSAPRRPLLRNTFPLLTHALNSLLTITTITLRTLGKLLAVLNTFWVIIHCMFEFTSFYDNCWCKGNVVSYGMEKGYWLWQSDWDLRSFDNVGSRWGGATALGTLVPWVFVGFFMVASHHHRF